MTWFWLILAFVAGGIIIPTAALCVAAARWPRWELSDDDVIARASGMDEFSAPEGSQSIPHEGSMR